MMKKPNILVVTDNRLHQAMLGLSLSNAGFTVTMCGERLEALNRILMLRTTNHPFDLVVLDVAMPGLSAEDFIQNLRKAGVETSIVVFSNDRSDSRLSLLKPGKDVAIATTDDASRSFVRIVRQMLEAPISGERITSQESVQ
jgi:DNA-binding response OmpR family regulator